eukprot:10223105-Karenia_brevis.AAC.1
MYFTEGWSKLALQQQGRWASDTSFSVYLQEAMAMLVWTEVPSNLRLNLDQLGTKVWELPPRAPWMSLANLSSMKKSRLRSSRYG